MQVGGINIIEYDSYIAFNECKRLKISILKHRKMFGECTHISADRIYATNENRKYCTKNKIQTNFCRKGAGKDDKPTKKIKEILNKQRSTSLEGSFGTEKEHRATFAIYLIKSRLKTLKLKKFGRFAAVMFFGVHTANAVKIVKRRKKLKKDTPQAA